MFVHYICRAHVQERCADLQQSCVQIGADRDAVVQRVRMARPRQHLAGLHVAVTYLFPRALVRARMIIHAYAWLMAAAASSNGSNGVFR